MADLQDYKVVFTPRDIVRDDPEAKNLRRGETELGDTVWLAWEEQAL
jgi:hypothetical protein